MTSSKTKFLRRVRIHGGECGAVARALHHKVKGSSLYQADLEKASRSTNERKSMSTKTSLLKRVAQSAVLALVGGLLSMVATPVANAANPTSISATCVARAGVGGFINVAYDGDGVGILRAKQTARVLAGSGSYSLQTNVLGGTNYTVDSASTSASFQLMADTITTGISSVTYLVWVDYTTGKAAGSSTSSPDSTDDITTSVTCNVAGAPASFSLAQLAQVLLQMRLQHLQSHQRMPTDSQPSLIRDSELLLKQLQ
jgi:hypothetical protein